MKIMTGNVKMALGSIRTARWRSWLTMLGIVIGVSSVVTIVSIGQGIKQQVTGQINHLGKDVLTIRPGSVNTNVYGTLQSFGSLTNPGNNTELSPNDLQTIRQTPGASTIVPFNIVPGMLKVGDMSAPSNVAVIGTTSAVPQVLNQKVQYGDFFTAEQYSQNVAVIGHGLALSLFGSNAPLGQAFTFRGQQFLVSGVMNTFVNPPLSFDVNFNNAIFIPYPIATQLEHGNAPLYEILVKPNTAAQTNTVAQAITSRLQAAHGGAKDFSVLKQSDSLAANNSILNLLTGMISSIAAISLLVAGIGIMNVMLVSVTERTHEIGIRKAVGATNRQIRSQFLTEAVVISLAGSLLAILVSVLANLALRVLTDITPAFSWQIMLISVAMALVIGTVFGLAPAVKAARKDPIDALRNE